MFKNYFKTAFRNLLRNKSYTSLNILGLAVGMTIFLLIAQYVKFERSYEDFIPNRANIYRVSLETYRNNELVTASAENYPAMGPAMQHEIPGITAYARLLNMGYINNVIITNENARPDPITFKQHRFLYADSSFLPMMGYQMINGNAAQALAAPFTAVISEKYAKLYFGKEDPIGKTLHMHDDDANDQLVNVTGVFKDLPPNTHLKFDILFSYKTLFGIGNEKRKRFDENWTRPEIYTFIQLQPGIDPKSVESRLAGIYNSYRPQARASNEKQSGRLQPLKDIHLKSDLSEEMETNGNANIVFFLSLIGIFILIIAWINYVNLSTARAIGRAREVGVRKVIGALKSQLIVQFLAESVLVNLLSLLIAYGLVVLSLPYFNAVSGLSLNFSYLIQPWFFLLLSGLLIGGSFLSGFYPSWVLSYFKPIVVLKGKFRSSSGGILLRKSLVVVQFVASIALIAGTIIVYRQLGFMTSQNLGMNINQVLVMDRPGVAPSRAKNLDAFRAQIDHFRYELKGSPDIEAVSNSTTIPGKQREFKTTVKRIGGNSNDSIIVRINSMDVEFIDVFKMQLLAGRNFSRDFPKDPDTSVIITASAAKLLGFKTPQDAIGATLLPDFGGWAPIVVGVVNDYHQVSFKKPLEPTLFTCDYYEGDYYSVRINTTHLPQTLQRVQQAWTNAFPGNPFEYFFLDDYFNKQYANERKFGQLFTTFAIFAIIISCLGLFGLSAYTASQRIKEIGIRKVLGASVTSIATMLSKDFLKLVIISILLASPLTWFIMNTWLQGFAYRISIDWWVFVLAGFAALLIALITVSFQAVKAAMSNPVKTIRTE